MNEEELKNLINTVAGIDVKSEFEASAKEELLSYVEQLEQENMDLKTMILLSRCSNYNHLKCGERHSINYCKENYELEQENNILTEFEKWLDSQECDIVENFVVIRLADIKGKLQELKEGEK